MQPGPVTFRTNLGAHHMPDYVKNQKGDAIVTTSDGVLIGLL